MSFKISVKGYGELSFEEPVTPYNISRTLGFKDIVSAKFNNRLLDIRTPIEEDGEMSFVYLQDSEAAEVYRHTMAHIMAQAVIRVYGKENVRLGIGPAIENGFYYDFEILNGKITEEDLQLIEKEMNKIVQENLHIERIEMTKEKAIELMKKENQVYKLELIENIEDDVVTFFKQGEFTDLCRGPHLPSTGLVKHFKLLSVSGAYWRGDERNPMLQRIYGTAFLRKEDLENYLNSIQEAKKRDHRKLGPALDLFVIDTEFAPGMAFFTANGTTVLNELMRFSRELHTESGYKELMTPLVMSETLWRISGHWDHYKENMYFTSKEEQSYAIKPMNCPGHIIVYKSKPVSYRDLPLRYFEFGRVHRYERSGVLHGIFRVRGFIQDDAHIFCTPEQVKQEVMGVINLTKRIYSQFGFDYSVELSTMPEDHMGDEIIWERATRALKSALESVNLSYTVNEGEGAFYGPKIDFHIKDSLGRMWQCTTIQLDFLMPERFNIVYTTPSGEQQQPVMIHRAIYGSLERFFGILIEHFAGAFPTWLSPIQVAVVPIADRHIEYAKGIHNKLQAEKIRIEIDARRETLGYKLRDLQIRKIPYVLIVGDKEIQNRTVSIRTRHGTNLGSMKLEDFENAILKEIEQRSLKTLLGEEA